MTLQEARNYADEKKEILEIESRISRMQKQLNRLEADGVVTDTVKGTRRDGTIGPIKIRGTQTTKILELRKEIKRRRARANNLKEILEINTEAFEEYVYAIENGRVRRMMSMRYIDGNTWQQIADRMGYDYTADSCRKTLERYFKENK